jgi:DNA-directed RNA polymerase alpha subunit
MREPSEQQKAIVRQVLAQEAGRERSKDPFRDRGFSDRTVEALIAWGIAAPERLLFATEAGLKQILGIGKASLGEIMSYRARFLPGAHIATVPHANRPSTWGHPWT